MSEELCLAWKGDGNNNINVSLSRDNGRSFVGKATFSDTSDTNPALASNNGRLYLAWKGEGNNNINVAKVVTIGDSPGNLFVDGRLEDKVTLGDTTPFDPALASV